MTDTNFLLTATAVLGVLGYYILLWFRAGRHSRSPVVIQYSPPQNLSPAMLRYIWKERFDDRTFWSCILSLVSKGFVILETEGQTTFVRRVQKDAKLAKLPPEEMSLLKSLFHRRKRESLSIDDATTAYAIWQVAQQLRKAAVGKWFSENRKSVIVGTSLSILAICIAANPQSIEEWGALGLSLCFMLPGGYYLLFVALRLADLIRAAREHFEIAIFSHVGLLLLLLLACLTSFVTGFVVLAFNLGITVVVVTGFLATVNVGCLLWLRMPTKSGLELLDAIDGFREFLKSVEQLPMDKLDAPRVNAGLYEEYLPYAVALEVEQSWCDGFLAANSSYYEHEVEGTRPFYLGMWDGKPVEVAYRAGGRGY